MYTRFYGLREHPFSLSVDARFFFADRQYASARTMLDYAVLRREGVSLITGEVGCGKSMLVRTFMAGAPENLALGVISNPLLLEESPANGISQAFGLQPHAGETAQLHNRLYEYFRTQFLAGRSVMLIVDEAQHLSRDTLEQLCLLANPEADSEAAMQLVLVGQSELRQVLNHPQLNQLLQRVSISLHLEALTAEQTLAYIDHRLQAAGAQRQLFTDAALIAVHEGARGVPRMVNLLCDMAMLYGYAEELTEIDESVIAQVLSDRGLNGAASETPLMQGSMTPKLDQAARPRADVTMSSWEDSDRETIRQVFGMPGRKN